MAERLFNSPLGFSDDNISWLSGSGIPGGDAGAQDDANLGSIYSDSTNGELYKKITVGTGTDKWEKVTDSAEVAALQTLIDDLQTELDATQTGAGLDTDGSYVAVTGSNYLDSSTSLANAASLLDAQAKVNADAIAAEETRATAAEGVLQGNIDTEEAARIAADAALQTDVDSKVSKAGDTMTGNLVIATGANITLTDAPTTATDAANKGYVDATVAGLTWKNSVIVMSDANITLSAEQTIDGVSVVAGDRVLVSGQTNAAENGIYVVDSGAWTRSTDFDETSPINEVNSAAVFVEAGTTYADTGWTQVNDVNTIDTDDIAFTQFNGAAGTEAGSGLSKTGNTLDVNMGAGIGVLPTDEVGVDLRADGGLQLTTDGSADSTDTAAQLQIRLSDSSLTMDASGIQLSDALQTEIAAATATNGTQDTLITGLQSELDATQTGAGLSGTGAYVATGTADYISTATSLDNADQLLDTAIKAVADDLASLGSGSITDLQTEVDNIETSLGTAVNTDGSFNASAFTTANYINTATSVTTALTLLDGQVKTNNTAIANNTADIAINTTDIATNATAIGDTSDYTSNNHIVDGEDLATTVAKLDAALGSTVVSESDTGSNTYTLDSVAVDENVAAKWLVTMTDVSGNRQAVEVYAMHDGYGANDATGADFTVYAKLKLGNIAGSDIDVTVTGSGAGQTMNLVVSANANVDVTSTRLSA